MIQLSATAVWTQSIGGRPYRLGAQRLGLGAQLVCLFSVVGVSAGENGEAPRQRDILADFFVTIPAEKRPIPEPLPEGGKPGFAIRGTKGWNWTPQQYMSEIPVLARFKMNFLMNCYLSMFDERQGAWNSGKANRWWEPLPAEKKRAYEEVVQACRKYGVEFCFAMNPNFLSPRPLDYQSRKDFTQLWQHFEWMAGLGVNWFSICLDDITHGIDARGQASVVNAMLNRLRSRNPKAQMVFCPTRYWGNGEDADSRAYLDTLAQELHPDVYCFWTGDGVVGRISRTAAESYKRRIGHRLIIWDNYPVNDDHPTLHLGPVIQRDRDLHRLADGYMANPLCKENDANRIPLITEADYAYNPTTYEPARSIGQAILQLADTPEQRQTLKDLVELYPGMLLFSRNTGWNPVLARFDELIKTPHARHWAELHINHVEGVASRLEKQFPKQFDAAIRTIRANIAAMKASLDRKYGRP